MEHQLDILLKDAMQALEKAKSHEDLERWRIKYIGSKGEVKKAMRRMADIESAEKPAYGLKVNKVKVDLEGAFKVALASISNSTDDIVYDFTEPGIKKFMGQRHVISKTIDQILDLFARMGFDPVEGPEVEDEWHNFEALNIPKTHPARDPIDNFYLEKDSMLRSQTSTVQVRIMENKRPPLRVVAAGRVYRPDTHDATHYSMFHQVEGLMVDEGVTMVDLKSALLQFAKMLLGAQTDVRFRPSFFPFTEPSAEVDMLMNLRGKPTWVEMGGCGMVDPEVFKSMGINSEQFSGYAFGLGVERLAMIRYGIKDIRHLFQNDIRFLRQFS